MGRYEDVDIAIRGIAMTRRRWGAVIACTAIVGAAIGILTLILHQYIARGTALTIAPLAALFLLAAAPFAGALLSGRPAPFVAGAGGLALGVGATVAAAAIDQGGTGAFALTLGVAVSAIVALDGPPRALVGRIVVIALLGVYAGLVGRVVSATFAYPLVGIADEIVESFSGLRRKRDRPRALSG